MIQRAVLARLDVDELGEPPRRVDLLRGEDLDHRQATGRPRQVRVERLGIVRVEEVREDDPHRTGLEPVEPSAERLREGRPAVEGDRLEEDRGIALDPFEPVADRPEAQRRAAPAGQPGEEERQLADAPLLGTVAGRHRDRAVEEDLDGQPDLRPVEPHEDLVAPRERGPVDVPRVVAGGVGPEVLDLDRAAGPPAQDLADPRAGGSLKESQPVDLRDRRHRGQERLVHLVASRMLRHTNGAFTATATAATKTTRRAAPSGERSPSDARLSFGPR